MKTEEILIDIVTASEEGFDSKPKEFLDKWAAALQALELTGKIVGILHTKNDSLADIVKDEGTEVLFGQDYFYEELLGLKFKITPSRQIHLEQKCFMKKRENISGIRMKK